MLKKIAEVREFLKGKKSYILCGVFVVTAVMSWAVGDISGHDLISKIVEGFFGASLRAGVGTIKDE
jgi:hypothetical protein